MADIDKDVPKVTVPAPVPTKLDFKFLLECEHCHNQETIESVHGRTSYPGRCRHCNGPFHVVFV